MFRYWNDFDRTFSAFDELRRQLEYSFLAGGGGRAPQATAGWPRAELTDDGNALVLTAEVPGLAAKDIDLQLDQGTLTIKGERPVAGPEGYSVHRQERPAVAFSRSFALPVKVDPERATADVKHGVLTVRLDKAPESKPRQITVKAS